MTSPANPLRLLLAVATVSAAAAGTTVAVNQGPDAAPDAARPASARTAPAPAEHAAQRVPIECGGYDAEGDLVNPDAARIDHAEVTPDGRIAIPAICGGYTADGAYIGDD